MSKHGTLGQEKCHDALMKELKEVMKKHDLATTGTTNDLHKRCDSAAPPIPTKKKHEKLIKGRAG